MKRKYSHLMLILIFPLLGALAGCTGLGKLTEGEYLFSGAEIVYDSANLLSNKHEANSQLNGLIKSTNTKFLWMRPFLSIHNLVKEPKKDRGLRYWIKYRLGEPPVTLGQINLEQLNAAMVNRLNNLGHFQAISDYQVIKKKKTAGLEFYISPGVPYYIRKVSFPDTTTTLEKIIKKTESETLLYPQEPYSLEVIKDERARIDAYLKDHGYFYFSTSYLIIDADTTVGNKQIDLSLKVKPQSPYISKIPFTLEKIYVYDDFSLEDYYPDTVIIRNYYYISAKHAYKPKTILEAVFLHKDSLYSRHDHYNTLSHLMGLGVYKFANARFNISDTLNGKMNAGIYLTPKKKMSIGAEMSAAVKTNNYAGPGLKLSFKNRNIFKGAELFSINLGGRFETQFSGQYKGETSYEITLDGSLAFPRFVPFRFNSNLSRQYVPQTAISVGGGLFSRVRYYELHSFNISLSYNWRSSERITQTFKPADISFTNLAKSSVEFQDYLDQNPTIKRSFEEQFILGSSYVFTYSTLYQKNSPTSFMVSQGLDLAGNMTSLVMTAFNGSPPSSDNPEKLLDVPYSQFVRLRNEMRFFMRIGKKDKIGMRLITGAAMPYGNSSTIPYVKQFFVGGTNSIRAFRARSLGPGTYVPADTTTSLYIDQSGDIKIETSIEYRFPIYSYFQGGFFADAGNIWLVNDDPQRPGGNFEFDNFYKEFAVGVGAGIRLDFSFVILRFDAAFPVRKPWLPEGDRWVFDKISIGSKSWRKENIIFNIAIGHAF